MGMFYNNGSYTFKAHEIIAGAERAIKALDELIPQNEAIAEKTHKDSALWKQLRDIEDALDLPRHLRASIKRGSTTDTLNRSRRRNLKRTIRALKTQDPHRQYRLDMNDIDMFCMLPEDKEDEDRPVEHIGVKVGQ